MTTAPTITPAALAALMTSADAARRPRRPRARRLRARPRLPRHRAAAPPPRAPAARAGPGAGHAARAGATRTAAAGRARRRRTLALGYRDVRVLEGGLAGWRATGRPTVQGINVPSKVFGERALHVHKTPQIAPQELTERIARGEDMVIVDSRTPEEYARGCVPGRVSVPGGELVLRIVELVQRPDQPIVVHCGGRTRSYIGAESLRRMGLPNPIVALENGTMGWELAGLTLERGATPLGAADHAARARGGGARRQARGGGGRDPVRLARRRARAAGAARRAQRLPARRAHARGVRRRSRRRRASGCRAARPCRRPTRRRGARGAPSC